MKRLIIPVVTCSYFFIFIFVNACGQIDMKDEDDDTTATDSTMTPTAGETSTSMAPLKIALAGETMKSLPLIKTETISLVKLFATPAVAGQNPPQTVTDFFKFECHWGDDSSPAYCPTEIKEALYRLPKVDSYEGPSQFEYKPYKYSATTLIGNIYHAEQYLRSPYPVNDGTTDTEDDFTDSSTAIEDDAYVFKTNDSGGNAERFVIKLPGFYNRHLASDGGNQIFHKPSGDIATKFGSFVPMKNTLSGGSETAFFQSYATTNADGTAGRVMAFNSINISTMFARTIIITNFEKGKFVLKNGMGSTTKVGIVALGKGGVDLTTGADKEGQFYVWYSGDTINSSSEWEGCIDNATKQTLELDGINCADLKDFFDGEEHADFVATYLELTEGEKSDLAPFLAHFIDNTLPDAPESNADVKDVPDSIDKSE